MFNNTTQHSLGSPPVPATFLPWTGRTAAWPDLPSPSSLEARPPTWVSSPSWLWWGGLRGETPGGSVEDPSSTSGSSSPPPTAAPGRVLHSHWSNSYITALSLVQSFQSYAIKNQLGHPKPPTRGLFLAGSLWQKGAYNRAFPCIEANYPYAIKNQRGTRGLFAFQSP